MLLRAVVALGGLTFLATGAGIMFSNACRSVLWGSAGSDRAGNLTATCHDAMIEGAMPQGIAAAISFAAGTVLILMVVIPSIVSRRRADSVTQFEEIPS